jgi:hypothetical protein
MQLPGRARSGPDETPSRFTHAGERHRTNDGTIGNAATTIVVSCSKAFLS